MKQWIKRNRTELMLYFGFLLLHLILMQAAKTPLMYGDERGYIGWARKILYGLSDGVRYLPGYSLFLLPVFKLTNEMSLAYPLVLAVNGIIGGFLPVGIYRLSRLFNLSEKQGLLCGVVCALYPAYLLYANMALCEILLATLFVLYLLQCGLLSQHPEKKWGWFRLGCIILLLVMTHTRALIVLPALAVSLPVLVKREQRKKAIAAVGLLLVVGIAIAVLFFTRSNTNTLHLQEQLAGLLTSRGMKDFLYAVLSQGSYLLCATFFIGAMGVWHGIRMIAKQEQGWQTAWCVLSCWCFLFLLSCVYMSHHEKPVHILYGRYNDCMTAGILLLGVVAILKEKRAPWWLSVPCLFALLVTGWKQAPLLAKGNAGEFLARISSGSVDSEVAQVFGIGLYRMVLEVFDYWQMVLLFSLLACLLYVIGRKNKTAGLLLLCALFFLSIGYTDITYFKAWSDSRSTPSEVMRVLEGDEQIKVVEQEENNLGYAWEYDRYMTYQPTLSINVEEEGQGLLLTRQSDYHLPLLAMEQNVNIYLWARDEKSAEKYQKYIMNQGEESVKISLSSQGRITLTSQEAPLLCYGATQNIRECTALLAVWYDEEERFLSSDRLELPMNLYRGEQTEWLLEPPSEAKYVYLNAAQEFHAWLGHGQMYEIRDEKGQREFVPIEKEADETTLSFRRIELSHLKEGISIPNTTWKPNLSGFHQGMIGEESIISNISCSVPKGAELIILAEEGNPLEAEVNGVSLGKAEWKQGCYRFFLHTDTITEIVLRYPVTWNTSNIKLLNRWYQSRYEGLRLKQIVIE